ncbi:MAG: hypothetical protein RQ899_07585 [Pseudomonadales bacterium]|nr:hypothetical protein [Pseudomonadales bacterium]
MSLPELKTRVDIIQGGLTIAAILAAGWWFLLRGDSLARAEIEHHFYAACLNQDIRWVRAIVDVKNVGLVRVDLERHEHHLVKVLPLESRIGAALAEGDAIGNESGSIDWPELANFSFEQTDEFLEPGETHTQYYDFLVPGSVHLLQLTSFFDNPQASATQRMGWRKKSLFDTGEEACKV